MEQTGTKNERERAKISKSTVELMSDLGIISDLPESNQLSFFDFTM